MPLASLCSPAVRAGVPVPYNQRNLALTPGTRLGVYEVTTQIGEGGMGQVWRARDTQLNRDVALKVLPDSFANDPDRLARFTREAQTLAALNHPNIAAIYGIEAHALVMELVEGEDLSQRIARGAIPLEEALPIAKQIAEALEAAHEQGIIHRDLKPANIKVRADGTVKVLDFGLAKAMDPAGASSADTASSPTLTARATQMGMILGTAAYMAPEQARGKSVDKRADIWAFGAVLYEMFTASQPFPGEGVSHVLARVIDRDPDWSLLPPALPASLRTCLQRCLVKDARQRMRDIGDVRLALEGAFQNDASPTPDRDSTRSSSIPLWQRLLPVVGLSVLLAGMAGMAVWLFMRPHPETMTKFVLTTPPDGPFVPSIRGGLAIASDGTVVYPSTGSIYVRRSGDLDPVPIRGSEGRDISFSFFDPDGTSVAYVEGARSFVLKRVPVVGGSATTIAQLRFPTYGASWGRGNTIVLGSDQGLFRVSANGGSPEALTRVTQTGESHRWPFVLPNGRNAVFTVWSGSVETTRLAVVSLETGTIAPLALNGTSPAYSPTGHLVYAVGGSLRAVGFDANRLIVSHDEPVTVLENIGIADTGRSQFRIAENGTLVYYTSPPVSSHVTLALVDTTGQAQPLGAPGTGYDYPRISPDGRWVAYQAEYTDGSDIAVFDIRGMTAPSRLTFGGGNKYPVWADGRRIIFQSNRDGNGGLFWQASDGTGTAERLTTSGKDESHIPDSVSRDGAWLTFTVVRGQASELWRLSLRTKKAESLIVVPKARVAQSVLSPDGRWIAYQSTETGADEIFVQPFPPTGAKYQVPSGSLNHHPIWTSDGHALYYVPGQRRFARVPITTAPRFGFGTPEAFDLNRTARTGGPTQLRRLDIMPDGKRFVGIWPGDLGSKPSQENDRRIVMILNWGEELKRMASPK